MVIKVLSENTAVSPEYLSEHGLSIFIESDKKVLFDTGASNNFVANAAKMGVDLSEAEYTFISHGHFDHGGGIAAFLEVNYQAKIFIDHKAFEEKYSIEENGVNRFIGIDKSLSFCERIILMEKDVEIICDNIISFRTTKTKDKLPTTNKSLYHKTSKGQKKDNFRDERSLIIRENNKTYLFAGCAHRGILNIVNRAKQLLGKYPDYVIGGFHLNCKNVGESPKRIYKLAKKLLKTKAKYFTCHCTGIEEYERIKEVLSENICYASCGEQIYL